LQAGDVMAIASSLLKPIYVAYALGESNGKVGHDEPIQSYAQIEDVKSLVLREDVGFVTDYDRVILVPYGEKTQFIDEQSLLWISVEPNTNKSNMDYKIERVGDVIDGNIILYCNSLTPNTKSLYYEKKGKIYQVKVDFDSTSLVAILPLNKYLPIDNKTKIWYTKPTSAETTKNLIRLANKQRLEKSYKLTFKKVGE
jgi:hypothetical protein